MTLTSLCSQSFKKFNVVVSDQSDETVEDEPAIAAVARVLEHHGNKVRFIRNLPRLGMAQQRQHLLDHATGEYVLFLDDDVFLESWSLETMLGVIKEEGCGMAGMFVIGLSYKDDIRLHHQQVEFWDGHVKPEKIKPDSKEWDRASLHSAANVLHLAERLNITPDNPKKYKVAWIGACKLYDTEKLRDVGGFDFWRELPAEHVGEDVMAQLKVMEKYGGCGILPSGAFHQEFETKIPDREVDAPKVLREK